MLDLQELYGEIVQGLADLVNAAVPITKPGVVGYLDSSANWVIPVPSGGPRIYVTVSGNAIEAINTGVPLFGGYPIVVTFQEGREPIASRPEAHEAAEYMGGQLSLGSAPHSHRWGWGNVDLVEGLRMEPGLVLPDAATGLLCNVTAFYYLAGGERKYSPPANITPTTPTGVDTHYWVVVGLNTTLPTPVMAAVYGTPKSTGSALTASEAADIQFPGIPLMGIRLAYGATAYDLLVDFIDIRNWTNDKPHYGFPDPVTKDLVIRSGRTVVVHGFNSSTGEITNFGEVYDLEGDGRITAPGGTFGDHIAGNYSVFENDGFLRMEGTARVRKEIQVKAEGLKLGATAPTQAVIGNFSVLQFAGAGTTDTVYTSFHMPNDWAVGTDLTVHIHWAPVNGNAGNVKWQMDWSAVASNANEVISGAGTNTSVIDAAQGLQDELLETGSMTIAGVSLAEEDTIGIRMFRDPTDGDDTYGSAASLVIIEFAYLADRLGNPT